MAKQKKQTFLQGALILTLATIVVKIAGALFKLPLASILGSEGLGYFMSAYTIFNFLNALAVSGLPIAVSKIVSEKMALGHYNDIKKVFSSTFWVFSFVGLGASIFMAIFARQLADLVRMPQSYFAMIALAPAIFFVCLMSIYRGYYQGMHNMTPTAISQIIEAFSKLAFGLGLAYFIMQTGLKELNEKGTLFSKTVESLAAGENTLIQYAAAAAVLGVTISTLAGTLYLMLKHKFTPNGITKEMAQKAPKASSNKNLIKTIIKIAIPVSLAAVVANLTAMIDLVSINARLTQAVEQNLSTLQGMYPNAIFQGVNPKDIPTIMYGAYAGIAITLFNLVPSITTSFGISALPNVTESWARNDKIGTKKNIESILRITSFIAFPAGIGLFTMAKPILELLYKDLGQIEIAAPTLSLLGFGVIFVSLSIPINSILQGVGRVSLPVKLMILGGTLKLIVNYFLVANPTINIKGAPIGSLVCYSVIVFLSLHQLYLTTGVKLNYSSVFIKPLFAGAFCGVFAKLGYNLLVGFISGKIATIVAIGFGGLVYVVVLLLMKALVKEDLLMLPKGKSIVRKLEKKGWL